MDYAYRVIRNVKTFYDTINPATLSGAIDVVVVEQPDGQYKSTPFHVRFGKYGVFSHSDKFVEVIINGEEVDVKMKLGDSGVAYFVEECEGAVPDYMITSPMPETIANQVQPDTQKVLTESAKKLEDKDIIKSRRGSSKDLRRSRDASPAPETSTTLNSKEPQQEQSLSEVQQRTRNLAFSSSVFSNRKNRSLPDLTTIDDAASGYHSDGEGTVSRHHTPVRKFSCRPPLKHSKSQAVDKKKKELTNDHILDGLVRNQNGQRRKKSVRATPAVDIKIERDSDSEFDSSVSSSTMSSPSPSLLDAHDTDHIADGALSDSEVDRHRNTPEPHANDVTDWEWGQMPVTRENQTKESKDVKPKEESSGWWGFWGKQRGATTPAPNPAEEGISLDELINNQTDPAKTEKYLGKPGSTSMSIDSGHASRGVSQPSSPGAKSESGSTNFSEAATPTQESINSVVVPTVTGKTVRVRSRSGQRSTSSNEDMFALSEDDLESVEGEGGKTYVRSLRLSSAKLKSLGLLRGANECRFSITTKFQGTSWTICNIYLYKWYEQIVISDVDGTITKSDVLGHVIPAIGGQWAHFGVADLYTRIKNNGYKMVYLSSRAIGQSHTTKQYLKSVAQDSRRLPDGPVLLSPTSVLMAFRREVIERRPEEFKIAALADLKRLFPVNQPFFAGFGNRETDVTSYRAVDIPSPRILIIDPSGRVRRSDSVGYVSNYLSMATDTVDYLFPPLAKNAQCIEQHNIDNVSSPWCTPLEHSGFTHWKTKPTGDASITDDDILEYEAKRKQAVLDKKNKKK